MGLHWWTWLIIGAFVILTVYWFWPRRNRSSKDKDKDKDEDAESSQEVPAESLGIQPRSSFNPVYAWAIFGGVVLVFFLSIWIKWIAGPYFERVPPGPTEVPLYMKACLIFLIVLFCTALPLCIYYLIIRPWRRERRITTDGILLVCFGLLWFLDPSLNYLNTWCTYNAWLLNMGSWVQDAPGWISWGAPGATFAEPILICGPGYASGIFLCTLLGCWVMRRTKRVWPNISNVRMIGVIVVYCFFWDIFMEGMAFMPMGFYTFPGSIQSLCIFPGKYYQYPIYEGIMWGFVQASFCSLRYFKDDRGRTFVERGVERINGFWRQQGARFLAIFAICSIIYLGFYTIPANWFGMHADPWPEDIQKRSYFMDGMFGEGTGRLAPHPDLPDQTMDRWVAIDDEGNYVLVTPDGEFVLDVPEGTELPEIIPFDK